MNRIFESYLFRKHILVKGGSLPKEEHAFETVFALANLFGIRIISGAEMAEKRMLSLAEKELGIDVPEPFYRGFPESVRKLTPDQLLFDQLVHYAVTYGFGDFSKPGHSLFEGDDRGDDVDKEPVSEKNTEQTGEGIGFDFQRDFARTAFKEKREIRDFVIMTEEEAMKKLGELADGLLAGTRPLSNDQYKLVRTFLLETDHRVTDIASKNTAVRLLLDLRSDRFADFLVLSDVIRLADEMNYQNYGKKDLRKLNLRNQDRKFLIRMIDILLKSGRCDIRTCFEKKKLWNGLLHHLHYQAKTQEGRAFVDAMRGKGNQSVYSEFEKAMSENRIILATAILREGKGSGAVIRNLNYLVSRCESRDEIRGVLSCMDSKNVILLLQLLLQYANYKPEGTARYFRFTKFELMKAHMETREEMDRRRTALTEEDAQFLAEQIFGKLKSLLKGRLGKVYINPGMERYALPIQETASQGGFGVLTRGTRRPIGFWETLRGFTYWEKVNDIDLSVFGITKDGREMEFSWRTMAGNQSEAITYSGDQTSGYYGGSEYFDIDYRKFVKKYPDIRYLVFCDNVFSGSYFSECFCRAGYMVRNAGDSKMIYDPKTVESAFTINCDSTFAYLFGIDLETNELIWLNMARDSSARVAGTTSMKFLTDYFHVTETMNVAKFFTMMATELVEDPAEAEVVVTDRTIEVPEGIEVIREYDFERMIALMNA